MRVRCKSSKLAAEGAPAHLLGFLDRWPVAVGVEYEVLSLEQKRGFWFVTFEDDGMEYPVSAPLALFDIIDPRVPACWNVRIDGTDVALRPLELDDEYFVDDVQEHRGDALQRYRELKARIAAG